MKLGKTLQRDMIQMVSLCYVRPELGVEHFLLNLCCENGAKAIVKYCKINFRAV